MDARVRIADSYWPFGDEHTRVEAYKRVLEIEPGHIRALNNLLAMQNLRGRMADVVSLAEHAHRLNPDAVQFTETLALANSVLGRDAETDAWLARLRARGQTAADIEFAVALFHRRDYETAKKWLSVLKGRNEVLIARRRGALAVFEGDWAEARRQYRMLFAGPPSAALWYYHGFLADRVALSWSLDRLGAHEEAREVAAGVADEARHEIERGSQSRLPRERLAVAELVLGDTAAALDALDRAIDTGFRDVRLLRTVPMLEPLREHPRFLAAVERLETLLAKERDRLRARTGTASPSGL
jgi:hypothetical protein